MSSASPSCPPFPSCPVRTPGCSPTDATSATTSRGWTTPTARASQRSSDEFGALARTVDPDDPWSHPDAERLDSLSVADWLRERGGTRNVVRARDLAMLALSAESIERTSLLAELRKEAAAGGNGFYDYEVWECSRVAEGSATVALRMAEELGHRIRYGTPVKRIRVSPPGCTVTTETGELFESEAVVCARSGRAAPEHPRRGRVGRAHALARPPAPRARREGGVHLRRLVLARQRPERRRLLRDRRDRRHLGAARGDHVHARAARAAGRLPHDLTGAARGGAHGGDGRGVRRERRATRTRSSSAAGAWTRSRSATSPDGARAT